MNQPLCRPVGPAIIFGFSVALLALFGLGLVPLTSHQYWWHVAVGETIWTWQRVPDIQLFLFTVAADEPWIYHSWLGDLFIFGLHELAGAELPLLMRNIAAATSVGLIAYYAARRTGCIFAMVLPPLLATVGYLLFAQTTPSVLTVVPVTIMVAAGFLLFEKPARFWPALLFPGVVLLVINIDFATAVASIALAIVVACELLRRAGGADRRRRVVASAAITACALPSLLGFAYPPAYWIEAFATAFSWPNEWITPSVVLPVLTAVVVTALIFRTDAEALPAHRITLSALTVVTAAISLAAPSTLLLFTVATSVVVCAPLASVLDDGSPTPPGLKPLSVALIILAVAAITVQPGVGTRAPILTSIHSEVRTEAPLAGTMDATLPLRCAEELRRTGISLQLFHDREHAGFLLHHLFRADRPHAVVFDDHRDLSDPRVREITELLRTQPAARGHFQQFGVNAAVIDRQRFPATVAELDEAPQWHDLRPDRDEPTACFLLVDPPDP